VDVYLDLVGDPFVRAERIPPEIERISDQLLPTPEFTQLQVSTGLDTLITLVQQRVEDLHVPIFLVVFQIGAVALAILAGVGSLVLSRLSFELAVLRSRGFSAGKLLAAQGVQARARLPDEAIDALSGVDLEVEVRDGEVRIRRKGEGGLIGE